MFGDRRNAGRAHAVVSALALLTAACGGDGPTTADDGGVIGRRDSAVAVGWTVETVAQGSRGAQTRLGHDGSGWVLAYLNTTGIDDGDCVVDGVRRTEWPLYVARHGGSGWVEEEVTRLLSQRSPRGLGFFASDEHLVVATMGGEPLPVLVGTQAYCGVHDAVTWNYDGSSWTSRTEATESNDAASGQLGSDTGTVVGLWPTVSIADDGRFFLAYQDVHYDGVQSDDLRRADLEGLVRAANGSLTRRALVDIGRGAGVHNKSVWAPDGTLWVAWRNEFEFNAETPGLWVAHSVDDGQSFTSVRVEAGGIGGFGFGLDPSTSLPWLAYYDAVQGRAIFATVASLTDFPDTTAWTREDLGDPRFDEGIAPTGVVLEDGSRFLAYRRCVLVSRQENACQSADDGLIFAYSTPGDPWEYEEVDEGAEGDCGLTPSMVVHDGVIGIGYRCQRLDGDALDDEIRFATRGVP